MPSPQYLWSTSMDAVLMTCCYTFLLITPGVLKCTLALPPSNPLQEVGWGDFMRLRHLYATNHRSTRSGFLQILSDGSVYGAWRQNSHSVMEIKSVARGVVVIRGVRTDKFLCVDADGRLHGSVKSSCAFRERLLGDGRNVYETLHSGKRIELQQGPGKIARLSRFLPVASYEPIENLHGWNRQEASGQLSEEELSPDSVDPLGVLVKWRRPCQGSSSLIS
uniref:Fibroblast growth factor n=1 Tax=Eptatretus burgeri TaxID=7764 RepID=A0A8C4Q8K4_EPTBU